MEEYLFLIIYPAMAIWSIIRWRKHYDIRFFPVTLVILFMFLLSVWDFTTSNLFIIPTTFETKQFYSLTVLRIVAITALSYFLFSKRFDGKESNKILCETHGKKDIAFICPHLNKETKIGFNTPHNYFPERRIFLEMHAVCDKCEDVYKNGWNKKAFELLKPNPICEECFFEVQKNSGIKHPWYKKVL